jgi:hypothetical protein
MWLAEDSRTPLIESSEVSFGARQQKNPVPFELARYFYYVRKRGKLAK